MSSRRTGRMGGGRAIGDTTARRLSKMARVNMFGREASKNRRVPKGKLRRAPLNPPPGYRGVDTIIGDAEVQTQRPQTSLPTILPHEPSRRPRTNYARIGRNPHKVPPSRDWTNLFRPVDITVRTQGDLKAKRKQARLPSQMEGVVDIDGDGLIDEVEIRLSQILKKVEGEDLDGDGQVTDEEIYQTRVKRGKQIYANTFVAENPGIRNFCKNYRYMTDDHIKAAIVSHPDFCQNMHNLMNMGAQYKLSGSTAMYRALAGQISERQRDLESVAANNDTRRRALFKQALSRQVEQNKLASKTVQHRKRYNQVPSFRAYAHAAVMARNIKQ